MKDVPDYMIKPIVDMSDITNKVKELNEYLEKANSLINELHQKEISLQIDMKVVS